MWFKNIGILKYLSIFLTIFISACSTTFPVGVSTEVYKGYPGETLSIKEYSTIRMGDNVEWLYVNDQKILHEEYGEITLRPGEYKVKWGTRFAVSALYKFSGVDSRTWGGIMNLKPGHTYTIIADRTTGSDYIVRCKVEESDGQTIRNITREIREGGQISVDD